MTVPLLATKLVPPTLLPDTLPRQRLFHLLDQSQHCKLLLICAPAGYGKTTLLRSWMGESREEERETRRQGELGKGERRERSPVSIIQSPNLPISSLAWLTLDNADNDPRRFVTYLLTAWRSLLPEAGSSIDLLLAAPQLPPLESIFTQLINEIASVTLPIRLVLDDYHLIENELIHAGMSFLIDQSPPTLWIAITSRSEPPLPLARWRVRRQLIEVSIADLRFSTDEAATFFQEILGHRLAGAALAVIETKFEGWVAGLQLAALALRGRQFDQPAQLASFLQQFSGDHRYIFDYLAEEVLHSQPAAVRLFLLQTAHFDRFCAELCDAACERDDSAHWLNQLERGGLFLLRMGERGDWFRYHALFAEFLRSQPLAERNLIAQRAAVWFAKQGLWHEAMQHALVSGDLQFAGRMIVDATGFALSNGLIGELAGWLAHLPDDQIRNDHELAVAKAWACYLMGQIPQAADYLNVALHRQPDHLPAETLAATNALRGFLAAAQGDMNGALEHCLDALEGMSEENPQLRSVVLLNLAQVQWWLGNPAALQTASEAVEMSERTGNFFAAMNALGTYAQILLLQGKLNQAKHLCETAIATHRPASGQQTFLAAIPLVNLGIVLSEQGNFGEAEAILRQGLELSQQSGNHVPLIAGNLALIHSLLGLARWEEAFAILAELKRYVHHFGASEMVEALEVELRLNDGELDFANRWVERLGLQVGDMIHHTKDATYLLFARWLFKQNKHAMALPLLERITESARQQQNASTTVQALILQSIAQQDVGNLTAAHDALQFALQLAAPENYRRPFLLHLPEITPLLTQLHTNHPNFISALLPPTSPPISQSPNPQSLITGLHSLVSNLPEPLSDRELDVLRLLANGLSNPEIAEKLIVGVGTVKTHVHNILGKLGVRNRVEAIEMARRTRLIS